MATFALISDPHVTVPNPVTGWQLATPIADEPTLYQYSVELLQQAIDEINSLPDIDFVLCAGDLTKDSEPYNHNAARELFTRFHKPVFCVPGNHDQPRPARLRPEEYLDPDVTPVPAREVPRLYSDFGFEHPEFPAFSCDPTPDIHLVGLCSARLDDDAGYIPQRVLDWLDEDLSRQQDPERQTLILLHHSIVDHVPAERVNPTFSWFHVENSDELKAVLRRHGVRLTFSGHLHIQDIKCEAGLYNIVTSSLAGFPHAYRVVTVRDGKVEIRSRRLRSIPSVPDLQSYSRTFTTESFIRIIASSLRRPPFLLPPERAEAVAQRLHAWWPSIAEGDERFSYTGEELGDERLAAYVNAFTDSDPPDNDCVLDLTN